ncbi:MAG: VOC family protein [Rhodospirillaceae bacterium]|jgi:catechol 2,3-dioxygenase-like lactoylglutathione lyase family enzyme|nr:VOC family protein [Rhodospirillaceae bacterium]MBT3494666.1 VOC family protein [Rhodospirillaceae bacterium]MBT3780844.1 VOC family protein [Rhodospirillaceae bacterium]MBT3978955.1 VOC family protein [Rhodospirillaceae bacterium]MBT4170884.1 VOC family protein [Rhodospirillaceae bacterium]
MFDQQVTFLYTADLTRSAAFYGETLGLPLALDQGACQIFRTSRDGFIGVCQCAEGTNVRPDGIIVTLVSADVDGWYERLTAQGVTIEAPPSENEKFNIYQFFLRDPDGYQLEIQRFQDPDWPAPA